MPPRTERFVTYERAKKFLAQLAEHGKLIRDIQEKRDAKDD